MDIFNPNKKHCPLLDICRWVKLKLICLPIIAALDLLFLCHFLLFFYCRHFFPLFWTFCTAWSSQHETCAKLIYTANQVWVCSCQTQGFILAAVELWCSAVEFFQRVAVILTCCCFDADCCRFFFLSCNSRFRAPFFSKAFMNLSLALVPRMQEVNRLAFCWAAVASHWPWLLMLVRKACQKHKQGR